MEPTLDQFDLLLTDADSGSTIGLRVDWSCVDQAPVTLYCFSKTRHDMIETV